MRTATATLRAASLLLALRLIDDAIAQQPPAPVQINTNLVEVNQITVAWNEPASDLPAQWFNVYVNGALQVQTTNTQAQVSIYQYGTNFLEATAAWNQYESEPASLVWVQTWTPGTNVITVTVPVLGSDNLKGVWKEETNFTFCVTNPAAKLKHFWKAGALRISNQQ